MTRYLLLASLVLTLAATGCTQEEVPLCEAMPSDPSCTDSGPADSSTDTGDGGDAGDAADTAIDAGPCGMVCTGLTPLCNETTGMCVACITHSDCTDLTAPQCVDATGTCGPCDVAAACMDRSGTGVCATAGDNMGACVECTASETTACGANPCTVPDTCSAFGTAQTTCEACDTDDNCTDPEHFCVPMEFPVGTTRAGGYCLKATPGCSRPLTIVLTGRQSLSDVTGQRYCGVNEALTTCEAVNALLDDATCPGGMDSLCAEGAICRTLDPGGAALPDRCTYRCGVASECINPPSAGSTCGAGGTGGDDYCGG